jgi:hypothetical protein
MYVLATVPHGHCPTEKVRRCDFRARDVSKIMISVLKKSNINYDIVKSNSNRSLVDLNRSKPETIKKTKKYKKSLKIWNSFNTRVINKLKLYKHKILLDIHSFNIGSFDDAHIVILDLYKEHREELYKFAEIASLWLNVNVKVLDGASNYIQDTYRRLAYPLLLEFCEDAIVLPPSKITEFFRLLLEYLQPIAVKF